MESNEEIVFEIKQTPPADKNTKKTDGLEHDDPDFEKPSLLKSITRVFNPKKPDDDLDLDVSPADEKATGFDDAEPKKSLIGNIANAFKKRSHNEEEDAEESEKSTPAKTDEFDDDFPKPSFLQNLFGRFGKKSDDEDGDDFENLKIPKKDLK